MITAEGFDFIDDIIWEKPAGAGWATSRGRRFAVDRNLLAYKLAPVTEYVMVYRKHTERLIDWNIRSQADRDAVAASKVADDYERTNVWRLAPTSSPDHSAVFPRQLSDRIIAYYSFAGDTVCDPFAGIATVAHACICADRRFVLGEWSPRYVEAIKANLRRWMSDDAALVECVNTAPISA